MSNSCATRSSRLKNNGSVATGGHPAELTRLSRSGLLAGSVEIAEFPEATQDDREVRELALIRAAEVLRQTFQAPALVGRLGLRCFGLILAGVPPITAENLLRHATLEIEAAAHCQGQRQSTVRFSVEELDLDTGIEQQF